VDPTSSSGSRDMHPGIAERAGEMAELVRGVRRLVAATVLNRAPAGEVGSLATELNDIAERLERHVPDPPPSVTDMSASGIASDGATLTARMAFDVVVGPYSPLALPVELVFDPPRALGRARFTLPYEGPPGCVHGAVIAGTFDIVFTAANIVAGAAGPTVSLTTRYRRATLLHEEAVFEAWVDRIEDRRVFTRGRLVQGGTVTVESEGVFALIDRTRTSALGDERRR
jgi:acyl-coenzyme A thioesterase PaaI-like protein